MDKEKIKSELISEVNKMINSNPDKFKKSMGLTDKLDMWSKKIGNADDFSKKIIDKLNEILNKHSVKFKDDSEKNDFLKFINPTIKELIVKNIKN